MDLGLFKKIINDAASYGITSISLTGFGEPFTDPDLFERCEYIRQKLPQAKIYVSSNCFLMTPEKYDNVARYIDTLKISIYGFSKEVYEKCHRGVLKRETSYSNILGFLDKIKGLEKKPYTIGLFVVTKDNKDDRDDWVKFWETKLNEVFVWLPHNFGDGRSYRKINTSKLVSCGRPFKEPLYIHADGKVSGCCFDFNKKLLIGDLKTETISDILNSETFEKLKKAHETKEFKGYLCENCDQINFNPDVLLYVSNKKRKVGQITSNMEDLNPK
jgi:radical SAM protein with 4Fe4S-binding SPASM domain